MSTYTKEQLINHIKKRLYERQHTLGAENINPDYRAYLKAEIATDEIALAALTAEPVASETGVDDDVRGIIALLESNEWAEHCTKTVLGSRLESEITRLVSAVEQPAAIAEVARAALDYIDALPSDVVAALPARPGFDRDWAENVLAGAAPQPGVVLELPEAISWEERGFIAEVIEACRKAGIAYKVEVVA